MTMRQDGAGGQLAPRESCFTEALGRAVCVRVAAGESLTAIGRDDGMPERSTVYRWVKANPEFRAELGEAQRGARVARRLRDQSASAVARDRALGNPRAWGGMATCRYTPEIGAAICERLAEGESLKAICRGRDWDGPNLATVYNWLKRIPAFADIYAEARARQADSLMDEVREVGLAATPATVWADRLHFDTLRWLTARLAPKTYCERIVAAQAAHDRAAEARERDGDGGGLTVIVKRYCDVTPEEYALAEEGEP